MYFAPSLSLPFTINPRTKLLKIEVVTKEIIENIITKSVPIVILVNVTGKVVFMLSILISPKTFASISIKNELSENNIGPPIPTAIKIKIKYN